MRAFTLYFRPRGDFIHVFMRTSHPPRPHTRPPSPPPPRPDMQTRSSAELAVHRFTVCKYSHAAAVVDD